MCGSLEMILHARRGFSGSWRQFDQKLEPAIAAIRTIFSSLFGASPLKFARKLP